MRVGFPDLEIPPSASVSVLLASFFGILSLTVTNYRHGLEVSLTLQLINDPALTFEQPLQVPSAVACVRICFSRARI